MSTDGFKFWGRATRKSLGKYSCEQVIKTRGNDRFTKIVRSIVIVDTRDFEKALLNPHDSAPLSSSI